MARTEAINFIRRNGGASATEFTIVLPLLILLLFAGVEGGRLFHDYHVVGKGVRDMTRYLSRQDVDCTGGAVGAFVVPAAETDAKYLAMTGGLDNTPAAGDYHLSSWTDPATIDVVVNCVDNSAATYKGLYLNDARIPQIVVTATVPIDLFFRSVFMGTNSLNMEVQHIEVGLFDANPV